jgi:hypothetical protein
MQSISLPYGAETWDGSLAAPTLGNLDSDNDLEIVFMTANSGLVAYDLPGTASARVMWATGRGNFERNPGVLPNSIYVGK